MRTSHYIAIAAALAITAALYWGVNTRPPRPDTAATNQGSPQQQGQMPVIQPASIDSILAATRTALEGHALEELQTLENQASAQSGEEKGKTFSSIGRLLLEHKQPVAAGYYYAEGAKLENSEKSLNFAGRFNSELLQNVTSQGVQALAAQQAIASFEQSLKLNPGNDTVKMALAACYIDGSGAPMQGIQLLLGIVREQPNHVAANLMLGQLSIRSNQLDKAQERFEKVLSIEPENTEALYFLAEVYKGKGDKNKAIELLEKCKRIINNPQFSKDIDEYIKSFK